MALPLDCAGGGEYCKKKKNHPQTAAEVIIVFVWHVLQSA